MSFLFDCKCFFGTIGSVLKHDGVVEGGTGEIHREEAEKHSNEDIVDSVEEIERETSDTLSEEDNQTDDQSREETA